MPGAPSISRVSPGAEGGDRAPSPMVSVVSPFYNRMEFLGPLVATLEAQTCKDFELVIADDGSTDQLSAAAASVTASFPVQYIRLAENRGAAAARNVAIAAARGRYIAFLDSDDAWRPNKLQAQLAHLENSQNSQLVSLTRQFVRGQGRAYVTPGTLMTSQDRVGEYLFLKDGIIQSSMMFMSAALAKATLFDEQSKRHDDWSFALRLQERGARFEMLADPLTIYNDEPGRARRSPPYSASRLEWLQKRRVQLGEAPYLAATAAVASHLRFRWQALRLIGKARRAGAIGPMRALYYSLAWCFPLVRRCAVALRRSGSVVVAGDELQNRKS